MNQSFFKPSIKCLLVLAVSILIGASSTMPIYAAGSGSAEKAKPVRSSMHDALTLVVGKSKIYKAKGVVTRISVGDPAIADVTLVNTQEVYILGKKSGSTNMMVWYEDGRMSAIDLVIGSDTEGLQILFSQVLKSEPNIVITSAGDSLVLTGQVSDAMRVQQAVKLAEEFAGKRVINMLTTDDLPQVLLEVKIAEVNKTIADTLGIQVGGTNFSFNMLSGAAALGFGATASVTTGAGNGKSTTWLQANITNGLIKLLAEPNIMAISGQEGQFLAGGILFIPIPQSSATGGGAVITLQQQPYGVGLKFTPTVLGGGRINLKVQPEVSQVNPQGTTVSSNGTTLVLPSITTRQASTTVQLYDGQSFAIGGLIQNNVAEAVAMFPGLANLPILGALFRSTAFQTDRTELLIVVTPRIVKPLAMQPELPSDKFILPTQSELFLEGKLEGSKPPIVLNPVEQK
jgi:pilus assembly protein CpaC